MPSLFVLCSALAILTFLWTNAHLGTSIKDHDVYPNIPVNSEQILLQCASLRALPGPPKDFRETRNESDRFESGKNSTLIRNATIWTGENNGTLVIKGDLLLQRGLVTAIGDIPTDLFELDQNLTIVEANGSWITPGLVDLHSHVGVMSSPMTAGTFDVNSRHGPVLPWLRSIDAFNTHDDALQLAIAGGVTSVQTLPGSGNAIGGQAFMMKLRKTQERSPTSMLLEPPHNLNGSRASSSSSPRWRHMKQACGENLKKYGTRMDSIWSLRSAYNEARKAMEAQDSFCHQAEAGLWESIQAEYPDHYQWEMLIDVLRGRVKISNHCYEAVDLDDIVRLTQEFKFPIASFHHAAEAWLVPDVLKRTWGGTPAIAIFATNHRYKREAYRGSEFAPRVLADAEIPVVMKSDHPVINSRYLLYEAQQAHYFGLSPELALASVTSVPAKAAGLDHRIGILSKGTDADVVLWDSHPLQLGATPVNVWIDGILQIPVPHKAGGESVTVGKGKEGPEWREVPSMPSWDRERERAVEWEGLPPLEGRKYDGAIFFQNVKEIWARGSNGSVDEMFSMKTEDGIGEVVVESGRIACFGTSGTCTRSADANRVGISIVDLHGGMLAPGLLSYGSSLGMEEIPSEPSTGDGRPYDPFVADVPDILRDVSGLVRGVDGLKFATRDALIAYRSGVTLGVTPPGLTKGLFSGSTFIAGLSTVFRTGSPHAMQQGAIAQDVAALHIAIGRPHPYSGNAGAMASVSTQIAVLRRLLSGWESKDTETGFWFKKASEGVIPLVIQVGSADIMATLLLLKAEIESRKGSTMRMVFADATEAHLLAKEIGEANVGVILSPARPFPLTWDDHRILAGPPLTNDTALVKLMEHGVTVGLGVQGSWAARNTRLDLAWAALESNGRINRQQAYALASTNLEKLLGVRVEEDDQDLVAYDGGSVFELSSKVVAVISPLRSTVDLFDV